MLDLFFATDKTQPTTDIEPWVINQLTLLSFSISIMNYKLINKRRLNQWFFAGAKK